MRNEIIEKFYIENGRLLPVYKYEEVILSNTVIYEVIRVIDGIPLFLENHMERMLKSAELIGFRIDKMLSKLEEDIIKLIAANNNPNKNIKLLVYNFEAGSPSYKIYFIKSYYPSPLDYKNGVHTILYKAERTNPNAKVLNTDFKQMISKALNNSNAYEAILYNEEGEITEGSKSNIFFVKGDKLYTSPSDKVLLGITRVHVAKVCRESGFELFEQPIHLSFLNEIDGIFLTGTSPKILPVASVDKNKYASADNPVITKLMGAFDKSIENYIKSFYEKSKS